LFDLIVIGQTPGQRMQRLLAADHPCRVGRSDHCDLTVDWEPNLSREQLSIQIRQDSVQVLVNPDAKNAVFFQGQEQEKFDLEIGQHFVIGSTSFRLEKHGSDDSSQRRRMVEEVTFDAQQLQNVPFRDADKRIEVLTHLPEVIWGTRTDEDFFLRIAQLLLAGIPRAAAVAIVELNTEDQTEAASSASNAPTGEVNVLHWDRRDETAGMVRPSARLVHDAINRKKRSVLHVWEDEASGDTRYTAFAEFNWAFCTPVLVPSEPNRGLYITGQQTSAAMARHADDGSNLDADVRFTELAAAIVSSLRRLSSLERHQAGLRQFFAPPILEALGDDLDTDVLAPRECNVTVLFCDLRGFSQKAESAGDDLTGLLSRVSQALGVMTEQILRFGGVTGDFQGDAALGFWGWPFESADATLNACRAALGIREAFEAASKIEGHPLSDFEMGIGIAHGRAVAGKIGTQDQVKVTVFGPVVNLASRLETMTSQLRVPILIDESTAEIARQRMDKEEGRTRRMGRVLPVGMETPVEVSELLPPFSQFPLLSDEQITQYELGVEHFTNGDWEEAWQCLHNMPAGDRAQDFLAMPIVQNNRTAPPDWDGVIRLSRK
jgi:adenylate cyclase